jgi:hypothetical protein
MTLGTRTEAERHYDAERDGTLYFAEPTEREILQGIIAAAPATAEDAPVDHLDRMIEIQLILDGGEDDDYDPWDDIIDVLVKGSPVPPRGDAEPAA